MRRLSSDATIAALLVAAVIIIFSDALFLGRGFYIRDVYRNDVPSHFVLRSAVMAGEIPSWNRFYSAGQPLAANPGYQAFYPGTWLAFLPSFFFGFNLELVLHVAIAAVGMYLLLRTMNLSPYSATFGATAFAFGGAVLSLTNLLLLLTSVVWWPWVAMFALRRAYALLAVTLGMVFLAAEVSVMAQTMVVVACFAWLSKPPAPRQDVLRFGGAMLLALGIGAAALVPAIDLKRDSGRAGDLSYSDATSWSMPAIRPLELFYSRAFGRLTDDGSEYAGRWRYQPSRLPLIFSLYCGVLVPLLALGGAVMKIGRWMWLAALVSYVVAIGSNGPVAALLYRIGVFRTVRYPEKFILFGLFMLIVIAAMAFDRIDKRYAPFLLLIAIGDLGLHVNELAPRMPRRFFAPPPVTLAVDGPNRVFNQAAWPVWKNGPVLEAGDRAYWSERAALLPYTPALYGLRTVYELDVNMTTLRPTAEVVRALWDTLAAGGSVRPFMLMGNAEYLIVPGRPIRIARGNTLPRYWFADQIVPISNRGDFVHALSTRPWSDRVAFSTGAPFVPARAEVRSARESSHSASLTVHADGQALLVASVTPHRYWQAKIDGAPANLTIVNLGFQGLVVPAGDHRLDFEYSNPLLAIGVAISLTSLLIALMIIIYNNH